MGNRVISQWQPAEQCLKFTVRGDFDFELVSEFRRAYESCEVSPRRYEVDLSQCSLITSAGLGMLIQLRRWVANSAVPVRISNVCDSIYKVLQIAKFDRQFEIER